MFTSSFNIVYFKTETNLLFPSVMLEDPSLALTLVIMSEKTSLQTCCLHLDESIFSVNEFN